MSKSKGAFLGLPGWVWLIAAGGAAWWLFRPRSEQADDSSLVGGGGGLSGDLYLHEDGPIATHMPVPFGTLPPGLSGDHRYRGEAPPLTGRPVTGAPVLIGQPVAGRPPTTGHLPPGMSGVHGGPAASPGTLIDYLRTNPQSSGGPGFRSIW